MNVNRSTYYPELKTFTADFSNFSGGLNTEINKEILPINYAVRAYNFNYESGTLKEGLGVEKLTFPFSNEPEDEREVVLNSEASPLSVAHYRFFNKDSGKREDKLLVYASNKKLYSCPLSTETSTTIDEIAGITLKEKPKFINYRLNGEDSIIFTNLTDGMVVWKSGGEATSVESAPTITSMCIHYERLFATVDGERNSVWFSDDLDPTNWTVSSNEGGFIEMVDERGRLNKVISFNDYLYIFRDYGIARVTAFAEQENFSVTQVYTSAVKIYPESVCVCGDRVIFLAGDGLYSFNGVSVTKINLGYNKMFSFDNSNAKAEYHKNKYYLSCKLSFETTYPTENNALIEFDPESGKSNVLFGYCIEDILSINTENVQKLVVVVKVGFNRFLGQVSQCGNVFGESTYKVWQSAYCDFGYKNKFKQVREVTLKTDSLLYLLIRTEDDEKLLTFFGNDLPQTKRLFLKGKVIMFKFYTSTTNINVSQPQVKIKVCR